jgi:hypothetical protein
MPELFEGIDLPEDVKNKIQEKIKSTYVSKDEFDAINAKKEELLAETKKAKMGKKELEDAAEKIRMEAAVKNSDIESLKKSYDQKVAMLSESLTKYENEKKMGSINSVSKEFVDSNVVDDPFVREAMTREFNSRLDLRDNQIVVLDPTGSLTALTVDDLKNEFMSNSKYAKQFIGSKASGGSATRSSDNSSNASGKKDLSKIPLNDKQARLEAIRNKLKSATF